RVPFLKTSRSSPPPKTLLPIPSHFLSFPPFPPPPPNMAGLSRLGLAAAPSVLRRLGVLAGTRAYRSAAAVEYHYSDEEEEEDVEFHDFTGTRRTLAAADGSTLERGVQWVLIGDPGAKKHLYAERLSKVLQVPHISMGNLLRQELSPRSSLYKHISNAVNEGKLVHEEVIFGLLSKRLEEGYSKGETGFILDSIPKTRLQAEILDQIVDIDLVVNFKTAAQQLVKSNYVGIGHSATASGMPNSWEKKSRGKAVEDYYRKQRKLLDFQVAGGPGETWQGLLAALHLKQANAVLSTTKLVA
ncbi:Probable adenylate kinase 7, mitochondrial, partial [Linum perenne]